MSADKRQQGSDAVPPRFAELVMSHGAAMDAGRIADAEQISDELMAAVLEEALAHPSPEVVRGLIADQAEEDGEWEMALQIYQGDLEEGCGLGNQHLISNARLKHARVEWQRGNACIAYDYAKQAVSDARLADHDFFVAFVLEQFSGFALQAGRADEAIAAANEGLTLLSPERSLDVFRAMLWMRKAEGCLATADLAAVRISLDAAWAILTPLAQMSSAVGVQSRIAEWWRLEAELRMRQGDWPNARQAWESALAYQRYAISIWGEATRWNREQLARILNLFAAGAEKAGEPELAATLRRESRSLAERTKVGANRP